MAQTKQKKPETVTFLSKSAELALVREQVREIRNDRGELVAIPGTGNLVEFRNGLLTVEEDADVRPTGPNGEDESVAAWLRRHGDNGEWFSEVKRAPSDPTPALLEIAKLAAGENTDGLAALYESELDTEARESVLVAAKEAIATIEARQEARTAATAK